MRGPGFNGRSIVNVVAELERRLTGSSASPGLSPELAGLVPEAGSYVILLFDGLGDAQLYNRAAATLLEARRAAVDAMFPTQTTVNLASVATGLAPIEHGLISYQLWLPEVEAVVNTLKWQTPWGVPVEVDTAGFLPAPNLWERLARAGREPITIQPGAFEHTPLTSAVYRGCRYEPVWAWEELVDATVQLARTPGRLILTYYPSIDVTAHMTGQDSDEYGEALALASTIWYRIAGRLPAGVTMVGIADHGHIDYGEADKILIRQGVDNVTFFGDPRTLYVRGPEGVGPRLAAELPATWVPWGELRPLLGTGTPHRAVDARAPDGALLADRGVVLLPKGMDKRMIGYHGGLDPAELEVPLLVASR
jgi:hypothetical protein